MGVRLTTRSSALEFGPVLEFQTEFTTSGALSGKANPSSCDYGQLPTKFRNSFRGCGYAVYSYYTPIAWYKDGQWVMPDCGYSVTTSKHQNKIRAALETFVSDITNGN